MVSVYWNGGKKKEKQGYGKRRIFYERFFAYILYGEGAFRKHAE